MKVTKEMIDAACESCPDLDRETVARALQAASNPGGEKPRPRLTRVTVFYILSCGVLTALHAILAPFVSFEQFTAIGLGLMGFLIFGAVALVCAWFRPPKHITH